MKCNNCNQEININENFCKNCGNKINNKKSALIIICDIFLYILALIFLLISILLYCDNKGILSLLYAIICIIFICPITYKLITKVFKDFNSIPIRITAIILTLIFSFLFIPTDNSNVSNTIENNKVVEDIISKEQNNELEQKKLEEEKKKLEEEKVKFEEEKRKQEEEKRKQEEEKAERIKNGETELKNGKFTLKAGHKGYYDGYFSYYIEGEIVNNTKNSYSYVQIQFNVYDNTGAQIGSAMDNINNLEANGTWKFKAMDLSGEPENIAYYKVIDITAF